MLWNQNSTKYSEERKIQQPVDQQWPARKSMRQKDPQEEEEKLYSIQVETRDVNR